MMSVRHLRMPTAVDDAADQCDSDSAGRCLTFLPLSFSFRPVPPGSRKLRLPDRRLRMSVSEYWASFIRKNSRSPRLPGQALVVDAGDEKSCSGAELRHEHGDRPGFRKQHRAASGSADCYIPRFSLLGDARTIPQNLFSASRVRSLVTIAARSRFGNPPGICSRS